MKIFVSYTTRDREIDLDVLKSLSCKLKEIGEVFIDALDNDSIDKQERVLFELHSCDMLLLLKTSQTYVSEWVCYELNNAKLNNVPVKVVSYDDVKAWLLNLSQNSISRRDILRELSTRTKADMKCKM